MSDQETTTEARTVCDQPIPLTTPIQKPLKAAVPAPKMAVTIMKASKQVKMSVPAVPDEFWTCCQSHLGKRRMSCGAPNAMNECTCTRCSHEKCTNCQQWKKQ